MKRKNIKEKRKMNKIYIFTLLIFSLLIFGCNDLFLPQETQTEAGYGTFSVTFAEFGAASARTVFPVMPEFDEYEYTFTPSGGSPELLVPDASGLFTLAVGNYTLGVKTYMGSGGSRVLAAEGVSSVFAVSQGNNPPVTVHLVPAEIGDGMFTYTINHPDGVTARLQLWQFIGTEFALTPVTLSTSTTSTTASGEVTSLAAGTYRFAFTLSDGIQSAGHSESIVIVPGLTTNYTKTFVNLIAATINRLNIEVTAPSFEETPVREITPAHGQYTGRIRWQWSETEDGIFAYYSKEEFEIGFYQATINLSAEPGYTLQGIEANTFTVNGIAAANAIDSGVVATAVFPEVQISYVYTITGTAPNFIATGGRLNMTATTIHNVIVAIRNDAGRNDSTIIFGDGNELDIGTATINFNNIPANTGKITLEGKVKSTGNLLISINTNTPIESYADITSTERAINISNGTIIINDGMVQSSGTGVLASAISLQDSGNITINNGTITGVNDAILTFPFSNISLNITGGIVTASASNGYAIRHHELSEGTTSLVLSGNPRINGRILLPPGAVSIVLPFNPGANVYTLDFESCTDMTAVVGGAAFRDNFVLWSSNAGNLVQSGGNLISDTIVHDWKWTRTGSNITSLTSIGATGVCSRNASHTDSRNITLTQYITSQTTEPVFLPIQINLGTMATAEAFRQILTHLHTAGKNVALDLSTSFRSGPGAFVTGTSSSPRDIPNGMHNIVSIVLPNTTILRISNDAFAFLTNLRSIVLPNTVTHIDLRAFQGCTGLTSITIPNSVTTIGADAFRDTGLTSITIPDSVTTINARAFQDCRALTSVTIPNSVTTIGDALFNGCTSLTSVTLPNNLNAIIGSMFANCTSLTSITIPNSVTNIGGGAFNGCTALTSINIPNNVTNIGMNAFRDTGLTSITIPNSVTTIGSNAFNGCRALTSVTLPTNTNFTTIEMSTFNNCTSLTNIIIPNSVTTISWFAFAGCSSLTNITIPNSVTTIGNNAFQNCGLMTVTFQRSTPPTFEGNTVFQGNHSDLRIFVPAGSATAYRDVADLSSFRNRIHRVGCVEPNPAWPAPPCICQ